MTNPERSARASRVTTAVAVVLLCWAALGLTIALLPITIWA